MCIAYSNINLHTKPTVSISKPPQKHPHVAPMNNRANLGTADQMSDMEDELTEQTVLHNDAQRDRGGHPVI